jgi:hypothetical protein
VAVIAQAGASQSFSRVDGVLQQYAPTAAGICMERKPNRHIDVTVQASASISCTNMPLNLGRPVTGSPAQIREARREELVAVMRPKAPRMLERLVEDLITALNERTVDNASKRCWPYRDTLANLIIDTHRHRRRHIVPDSPNQHPVNLTETKGHRSKAGELRGSWSGLSDAGVQVHVVSAVVV